MDIGGNFPEDLTQFLLDLDRDFTQEQQTNHSLLFVRDLSWSLTFHEEFIKEYPWNMFSDAKLGMSQVMMQRSIAISIEGIYDKNLNRVLA